MDMFSFDISKFSFFDIFIFVITLLFFIRGFKKGFTREIMSLIGFVLGVFFAYRLSDIAARFIDKNILHLDNAHSLGLLGFAFVFVIVWVSAILLGAIFGKLESANGIGFINRIFGGIVGGIKSFIILSLLLQLISDAFLDKSKIDNITRNSYFYPYMLSVKEKVASFKPKKIVKIEKPPLSTDNNVLESNKRVTLDNNQTKSVIIETKVKEGKKDE